jgi:hypothetical protein
MKTENIDNTAAKRCIDCSTSQQIKCFGIVVVSQGISKNKKCTKSEVKRTDLQG